ncbi:MAG: hypothetical protein ACLTZT_12880 [Butyricimonas faecalis]
MKYLSLLVLLFLASYASAQKNVIDKIIAVVGEEIVLKSDIENQFLHEQSQGLVNSSSDSRTRILENLLVQKLLVAQAKIDSIEVTDTEVENALNSQLEQYVQHIGSRERLETYFGKSYEDIKNEMRTRFATDDHAKNAIQNRGKRSVTPSEVRYFYRKFNKDSLQKCLTNMKFNRSLSNRESAIPKRSVSAIG